MVNFFFFHLLQVKVLVAGGCKGGCHNRLPLRTVEMYDPEEDTWKSVTNLPKPLKGASMEILDGLPTLIGGWDGHTENGLLYQYHEDTDEWQELPDVKMKLPRQNAAVFQVPSHYFPKC